MASYIPYTPTTTIAKAMFNFDAFGIADYKLSGTVNISVSDAFTFSQYLLASPPISSSVYTSLSSGSANWTAGQLANIHLLADTYTNFINLNFSVVANYSGFTPANVGNASDINISLIYRTDLSFSGKSALDTDSSFGYAGSSGDIILNVNGFGSSGLSNDYSLNSTTFGWHALMHEVGHSLGLSHPHSSFVNGVPVLTADFSATANLGFEKLGFHINSASDMNKEYFSIMSYDDQKPPTGPDTFAQTPMILDVIALQTAYGEGRGSSGSGNDVITPGAGGSVSAFRTYFDTGGIDTIDLTNYSSGAYLHMGTTIVGAPHLVGVSMSVSDANTMVNLGGDPSSLRWYYGEYENAIGSGAADVIVGNSLNNVINGGAGNDVIIGGGSTASLVLQASDLSPGHMGAEWVEKGVGDFNGDGRADVLWQNTSGQAAIWEMSGAALSGFGNPGGRMGADWSIAGVADFNHDGKADMLWRNTSGQEAVWLMDGTTLTGVGVSAGRMGAEWKIVGTADFNGDGNADILWQNNSGQAAIWQMNGTALSGFAMLTGHMGAEWSVKGTGDFNGDGNADILWQNTSGQAAIWQMTGTALTGFGIPAGRMGAEWSIAGAADFNQDGSTDILWKSATGTANIWLMDGMNLTNPMSTGGAMGGEWKLTGFGDFTGDGTADALWTGTSGAAIWRMGLNGGDILTGGAGSDRFVLTGLHNGPTTITDFQTGPGGDQLDVHALLTSLGYLGSDPLADHTLRLVQQGADAFVQVHPTLGTDAYVTIASLHSVNIDTFVPNNLIA